MLERSNHCVYSTHYHLVFPVKYRKALLRGDVEHSLYDIGKGIEERYGIEIEQVGADINHVHLLSLPHKVQYRTNRASLQKHYCQTVIPSPPRTA